MSENGISITCYVRYTEMNTVDNFRDESNSTMISMRWMRTHCCKTLLTFLLKLTSSCFSSFFVLSEPQQLDGMLVFYTTDRLSPNIMAGPSNGTPNIRRAYRISIISSVATLAATNSDPYVDDSAFCRPILLEFYLS